MRLSQVELSLDIAHQEEGPPFQVPFILPALPRERVLRSPRSLDGVVPKGELAKTKSRFSQKGQWPEACELAATRCTKYHSQPQYIKTRRAKKKSSFATKQSIKNSSLGLVSSIFFLLRRTIFNLR